MRLRSVVFALGLAALWLSCNGPSGPVEGAPCKTEGGATCDSSTQRLLACTASVFQVYSDCRGPMGCTIASESASCDTSGNTVGDRCAPTSEGKVRCDPDAGAHILRCIDGGLTNIFTCKSGTTCAIGDAGLSCY